MSTFHVATAAQAELLLAVEWRPALNLLMREAHSLNDLALALGISIQRVHYLMGKLLKAEVAVVTGERRRRGPPSKLYQVPHTWFIPFDITTAESLEALANAQVQPRIATLVQEILRVYVQNTGEQRGFWLSEGNLSLGDTTGAAQNLWEGDEPLLFTIGQLRIPRQQASEFKRRLIALAEECTTAETSDETYMFAVMMVRSSVNP